MRKLNFWDVPITGEERARVQDSYTDAVGSRMRDFAAASKDSDADRRHEDRVVIIAQAIRTAMSGQSALFSQDGDVPAMAAAAVAVYERERGR